MKKVILLLMMVFMATACYNIEERHNDEDNKPKDLTEAKKEVADYYANGGYAKEVADTVNKYLEMAKSMDLTGKKAVVFDIDETSLSNYKHIKEIGFGYVSSLWAQWEMKAEAPAIKEVKKLYDYFVEKGVTVFFLTGRKHIAKYNDTEYNIYEATVKNMQEIGYTKYDTIICRQEADLKKDAAEYKPSKRKEIAARGYEIVMCVGDQYSDLSGDNTGVKVKIPNYLYQIK